ncbi:PREDICTED: integrin alpha-PS3-like, partial [Rhagoletis zephyria]|uniref:integrin alpha-PS3-like n=1 Tax=Rhagoletis zephyria TaxID=28612 RepID=UPI000811276C
TGGIYKYEFDNKTLKKFDFQNEMPSQTFASLQLNSTQQWLGGAMDGGSRDADPLIACAPQSKALDSSSHLFMHGFCYWTNNTLDNGVLLQYGLTWKISPFSDKGRENKQITDKRPDFMFGELGFSVHMTPNNEEIIIGAPGIYRWSGATIHVDVLNRSPDSSKHGTIPFTYKGYAVASGFFEKNNQQLYYVATVPRAYQLLGQALIYTRKFGAYKQVLNLAGEQYGELFGYAVLVEDVNGDGLDDILIGAPYRTVNGILESGAVYMYINRGVKGQLNFKPLIIESPLLNRGRFGTTLSSLGDVNGDGYKDIAIGAPFADGGGAVAIYFGSSTGLAEQPRQILNVSDQFADGMFGHGLSKGVDIDANGFNDLAIGAPNADTVFIYRAYPVVKVIATIRPLHHLIPTTATNLQYEICYSILTNSTKDQKREILLDLTVDAKEKRVKILSFKNNATFTASRLPKCTTYNDSLKFDFRYEFVPIVLKLSYRLKYDAKAWSGA